MNQWVKQPLLDINLITERHDLVEAMQDPEFREAIEECLSKMVDLHQVARKFVRGRASLKDVVAIYDVLEKLPTFSQTLDALECVHPEVVHAAVTTPL